MSQSSEQRLVQRRKLKPPGLAVIRCPAPAHAETQAVSGDHVFVDVRDISAQGVMIETSKKNVFNGNFYLYLYDEDRRDWIVHPCAIMWSNDINHTGKLYGIQFLNTSSATDPNISQCGMCWEDLNFLLHTSFLENVPRASLRPLLNSLTYERLPRGAELIRQGDKGDCLYVIRKGSCRVEVTKNDKHFKVARLRAGDVVGEMAVLTGEPRTANVVASRDLQVWRLEREDFDRITKEESDLRLFLTELVAHRFDKSTVVADRSVGKYLIKRKLGTGGWSIVYAGTHSQLGMPVAIKMMRHNMAMEESFLRTFRQEANIIAALRHANIVQVYDIEEQFRTVFIIMEFLDGYSLKNVLEQAAPLPFGRATKLLSQTCAGLGYAHDQGIIHRDVKPANICVLQDDWVKTLDFGLACSAGTEDFGIAGTPKYAPPEQILGDPVDYRADMYSLGIMAYEMVVGERPFPEDDLVRLMDMHCEEDIPDPKKSVPDLPKELREFIMTCCERHPYNRFANMADAEALLIPLAGRNGEMRRRRMTPLFLFYPEELHASLTGLLEEFTAKVMKLGVDFRTTDFRDI